MPEVLDFRFFLALGESGFEPEGRGFASGLRPRCARPAKLARESLPARQFFQVVTWFGGRLELDRGRIGPFGCIEVGERDVCFVLRYRVSVHAKGERAAASHDILEFRRCSCNALKPKAILAAGTCERRDRPVET